MVLFLASIGHRSPSPTATMKRVESVGVDASTMDVRWPTASRVHPETGHGGPTGWTPSRNRSVSDVPALGARPLLPRAARDDREQIRRLVRRLCLGHGVREGREASPRIAVDAHRDGREDCAPPPAPESGDWPPHSPRPASGAALCGRACPMSNPASVIDDFAGWHARRRAGPRLHPPLLPPRQSLRNPPPPTLSCLHRPFPSRLGVGSSSRTVIAPVH